MATNKLDGKDVVTVYHMVMDGSTTLKDFEQWVDNQRSEAYGEGHADGVESAQSDGL